MSIASQYIRGKYKRVSEVGRSGAILKTVEGEVANPQPDTEYLLDHDPAKATCQVFSTYSTSVA